MARKNSRGGKKAATPDGRQGREKLHSRVGTDTRPVVIRNLNAIETGIVPLPLLRVIKGDKK